MQILDILGESILALPDYLVDANKRIFSLYLLSALLIAILVWLGNRSLRSRQSLLGYLFNKKIWWHESAKLDYLLFVVNRVFKALMWAPIVLTMVPIAIGFSGLLESVFGTVHPLSTQPQIVIGVFTLLLFLLDDFTRFLLHLALHRVPFLWDFHKVHHSAKVLTPMTIYRTHPLESYLYACRMAFAQGLAVGVGYFLFGPQLSMFDVLGANLFVFLFNVMGSNLRHSHVRWAWGNRIENWFVSPAQHQIHHSDKPAHFDKNLGSALAIWDRMCGTLVKSSEATRVRFGLGKSASGHAGVVDVYIAPFQQNWQRITRKFKR